MHYDQINAYKQAQPFQPFRLVLNDGETLDVFDRTDVLVTTKLVFVGVVKGPSGLAADLRIFTPEMVARIELLPAQDKAS